jgi:PPP family 3-phenylpropionic acid transporter
MRLWGSLGFTLTAIGLAALWTTTGYSVMFISGGIAFFAVAYAATLLEEARPTPVIQGAPPKVKITLEPGMLILLGATLLVGVGMSMGGTFGGIYMSRLGGTPMQIGAILGVSAMFEVPSMAVARKVFERLGGTNTLMLGYGLVVLSFIGFSLSRSPWALLFFTGFRGFGFGLYYTSSVKMINDRSPAALSTTYQSIMYGLGWGIAPLIGSPLSGILFDSLGPSWLFLIAAGVMGVAILALLPTYAIWRNEQKMIENGFAGEENVP